MLDYTTSICQQCGNPIGHRPFIRDRLDAVPEHLDCYHRARGEAAATDAVLPERRPRQQPVSTISAQRNAPNAFKLSQNAAHDDGGLATHTDPATFLQRFLTELAYYEADKPFLPIQKCAERCRLLSALLTAAVRGSDPRSLGFHQPPASRR
jgi:hypothetical protein